jgi:hypothetical protein
VFRLLSFNVLSKMTLTLMQGDQIVLFRVQKSTFFFFASTNFRVYSVYSVYSLYSKIVLFVLFFVLFFVFHPNMTIYIPNKSSHRADTKYAVFKNISSDFNRFCDEKQKRVQKRVQRVQFWSTKSTPFFCTLRVYSFTLFCTRKIWSPCFNGL